MQLLETGVMRRGRRKPEQAPSRTRAGRERRARVRAAGEDVIREIREMLEEVGEEEMEAGR